MKRKSMKITAGILAAATALAPLPAFAGTDIGATASESIAVETEDTGYSADSITELRCIKGTLQRNCV